MMHTESCRLFDVNEDNLTIMSQVCKEEDISIISTHDAIYFELKIKVNNFPQMENPVVQSVPLKNKTLCWSEADIDLYQTNLETILKQNFQFWNTPECIQVLALLIPKAYIEVAETAVPSKQKKDIHFKCQKSEDWLKAETAAKKASKKWIAEGRPRDAQNKFFEAKKTTKLNLRKAIKNNVRDKNTKDNNAMMEANFRDPKLFSKLVNRNRVKTDGYTALINVEGKEYRGDAQVLSGFFLYHNGNSEPPPVEKCEDNTK